MSYDNKNFFPEEYRYMIPEEKPVEPEEENESSERQSIVHEEGESLIENFRGQVHRLSE